MKHRLAVVVLAFAFTAPALAQVPQVSPSIKKMIDALPLEAHKADLQKLIVALKKTSCGSGLTGCYMAKSGRVQGYFFTSNSTQQTFLLVVNDKLALPKFMKGNVQQVLGGTQVMDPIISLSTTDFTLATAKVPADLQQIIKASYFNVPSLEFAAGVQLAARANLSGALKYTMQMLGVNADQLTMRAAVVLPIPTDMMGAAGAGAGLADALAHDATFKKSMTDAAMPEAFVEFQLAPSAVVNMQVPLVQLTDSTFFLNNALVFGYKGNAHLPGSPKGFLLQFQTPLSPEGAMDLLDFSFRMAMPATFGLQDFAQMNVNMMEPDTFAPSSVKSALDKYGGGYVGNIKSFAKPLLSAMKPLSVFQLSNPTPPAPYKFGDPKQPWPTNDAVFNFYLLGPLSDGGPAMHVASNVRILGQAMGRMSITAGMTGFHGMVQESMTVKLGPLGKTSVKMLAKADVSAQELNVSLSGNVADQKLSMVLAGNTLSVDLSASCVNPFEIHAKANIDPNMDVATILEGQAGVNVDPATVNGCVGKALQDAYKKIANEYSSLGGFSASQANAALNQLSSSAAAAYNKTKDAARDAASKSTNAAMKSFNDASNAIKSIGKKQHHHSGPDPKFAASVFDWDYYYDAYPDVVQSGADLATHWRDTGFAAGRQGSPEFSVGYYWSRYKDVQSLCNKSDYACILQDWLDRGMDAGRQGSALVSLASYVGRYPDLQKTYGLYDFAHIMDHWQNVGSVGGLDASPSAQSSGVIYGAQLAGGTGGSYWSDEAFCNGKYVTGVRLKFGDEVNGAQFRYGGTWANPHGYDNNGKFDVEITLPDGDYFDVVNFRSGDRVDQLTFKTHSAKTYGPYGGGGGSPNLYHATDGQRLMCMSGRAGSSIDRLVFTSTGPR